jgi:cytochrome P450
VSKGDTWRALRKKLSPTFTSGKLKSMLRPMEDVAEKLIRVVETEIEKKSGNLGSML